MMKFVGALACALFGAVGAKEPDIPDCWRYDVHASAVVMQPKDAKSPCLQWDRLGSKWEKAQARGRDGVYKTQEDINAYCNRLKEKVTEQQLSVTGGIVGSSAPKKDVDACSGAIQHSPSIDGGGGHTIIAGQTSTMTFTSTYTSTFTQTLTQSTAAGGEGAFVTLLIEGVDYSLLAARVTLRETMEMELKQAVAAGQAFSQEMVTVEMSSGSLLITFKITAAGNTDFQTLAQQLRLARDGIAQRAAAILRTIPGIAAITVGTLTVRACGLGLTRGAALTTCAADIAPEPMGSMPATLDSAVRIGGVVAADGLLADFKGSAAQGPHPALMFGLGAATALALAVPLSKKWNSHAALASTDVE